MENRKQLSASQQQALINILHVRFEKHIDRHQNIEWSEVRVKLEDDPEKLSILQEMETTGGEPDVVGYDKTTNEFIFYDCSEESPKGRRSLCYDREGQMSRKEQQPQNNAIDMAATMGVEILTEQQYRELQQLGKFDLKTSSWLQTPDDVRKLGGSIFGDRRYDRVFIYHNGAQSYYAARAFRSSLKV